MDKDLENWLYRPIYPEEEFFKKVEAALGFKLFIWQKAFIVTGVFRQYGETTAEILRELLDTKAEPLDYVRPPENVRARFYRDELREIQKKLQRAGIETRQVFWSEKERRSYYWKNGAPERCKTQIVKTARFHHAGKERQIMSNILLTIIALLLVSIWQQLKEINERGKGDVDGEKEKKGNAEFGNRK